MITSKLVRAMGVLSVLSGLAGTSAWARDREISVTGSCLRSLVPDRGSVTLTAETRDADPKRAAEGARKSYERVRDAVKRLNLEDADISTSEYSVEDVREWEKDKQVHRGYRARLGLKVETAAVARLGEVIEIASRESLKDVGRLNVFVSPKKLREEQNECLKEAAEQAKVRAEKLAKALGASLGEVVVLAESGTSGQAPVPMAFEAMAMADAPMRKSAAPNIEAGRQDMSLSVNAVFSIR